MMQEKIQLVNNKCSLQWLTFTQENKIKYNSSYKMLKIDIRKFIYENKLDYEFKKRKKHSTPTTAVFTFSRIFDNCSPKDEERLGE